MPLLAALAVTLCTAMVLIVGSVMNGFLGTLLASGQTLMGDAAISWPVEGLPYYEDLMEMLEARDEVEAVTPTIETLALVGLPDGSPKLWTLIGVQGASYDRVTRYHDTLWWKPIDKPLAKDVEQQDPRLEINSRFEAEGLTLTEPDPITGEEVAAVVPGVRATGYNKQMPGGWWQPRYRFMPNAEVTISVLPLSQRGVAIDVAARRFPIANEFQTGLYEVDAKTALIRLDALQKMLDMNEAQRIAPFDPFAISDGENGESFSTPTVVGVEPARVTTVMMRAVDGVSPEELRDVGIEVYAQYASKHPAEAPDPAFISIYTWQERDGVRTFIAAVKKEMGLTVGLFGFISLTAVFLVFAIFWSMVSDKTRDIGILRALGASRLGVAWVFIRYGVVIGVVGSLLGGAIAWLVVTNINPIHDWLGRAFGLTVWDPSIYYFTLIPNKIELTPTVLVLVGGVVFSVVGAIAPAIKAARMDPVRSLRFE
jgi:lipoprotein-releasing system permease protein